MPRILHTSDWHLGLELGGHSRLSEQELFLEWLLGTCRDQRIDALVVCGDIFDVLHPPVEAQSLLARFLVEFHQTLPVAQAVLVAGNHDSPARLEAPSPFTDALGRIRLIGHWRAEKPDDHLVPLANPDGSIGAICLAVPFLRSQDLVCRLEPDQSPEDARGQAIRRVYELLATRAVERYPGIPVICTGHLTLAGTQKAGSERILIGGVESVPLAAVASGATYTALGHIHRMQTVGSDQVRYSGSPLAMDFDEIRHAHGVVCVQIHPDSPPDIETIEVPAPVRLLRLGGADVDWEGLSQSVQSIDWEPARGLPRALQPLVELSFREDGPVVDLRERTEALLANLPARLVGAPKLHRASLADDSPLRVQTDLGGPDAPISVLEGHWMRRHGQAPPPDLVTCFLEAVETVRAGETP
ncbi:MAG: exonuclease subunit SbcD [Fibrobacteres bacterium]|nr:exonuclease subunit SbcD [Fibrobacterota bacterium]